jgi:hypothetical protein
VKCDAFTCQEIAIDNKAVVFTDKFINLSKNRRLGTDWKGMDILLPLHHD